MEPADVSSICTGSGAYPSFSCRQSTNVEHTDARDGRHTAHHRIPRKVLTQLISKGHAAMQFTLKATDTVKLSPIKLNYALMNCHLQTLLAGRDGQSFGADLFRPSFPSFTFPLDAPLAAGDATLWVHAILRDHDVHVKDSVGLTSQSPRCVFGVCF
jgi:hypothetical protein